MNSKERFLAVIKGETPDRTPVFPLLMHLAASKSGHTYKQFATNGENMANAQINMYKNYNIDAITACSDAFRITADLGADMVFPEEDPPHSQIALIKSANDLDKVCDIDFTRGRTGDRILAVKRMVESVGDECAVLGWVDMPFAECCSLCGVAEFMMILYDNPKFAHQLLGKVTTLVKQFAIEQLNAGAVMIGAGDAAASLVSPSIYREFVLPYEKEITKAIHEHNGLMKLHICGNTTNLLDYMIECNADLYNVDHLVDFELANSVYGNAGKSFKGNLDPVGDLLRSDVEGCITKARKLKTIARNNKYMLSAGCEVPRGVSEEVFRAFCNA